MRASSIPERQSFKRGCCGVLVPRFRGDDH
jgi:hypothetical protein